MKLKVLFVSIAIAALTSAVHNERLVGGCLIIRSSQPSVSGRASRTRTTQLNLIYEDVRVLVQELLCGYA